MPLQVSIFALGYNSLGAGRSYELAKQAGVERGIVEDFVLSDLRQAGFEDITSTVVAEAVWAENPDDLIPAAGDMQRYCIIQAQNPCA